MKNSVLIQLLFLFCLTGASQNTKYELPARQTPTVKKEKLSEAQLVTDLTPLLWNSMVLSSNERYFLDHRRIEELPQPPKYIYPQENYKQIIDYVAVELKAVCNGKVLTAKSTSDKITAEQKALLNCVDLGTTIRLTIKYKYKNQAPDNLGPRNTIVEGISTVIVVPETEAQYPGGFKQLSNYFAGNVIGKLADKKSSETIQRATVQFTVTEDGEIVNAKLSQTSTDIKIDKLILEAINKMPKWIPAINSKGVKVKQEISIPFGSDGC